jgi:hypothetical protein
MYKWFKVKYSSSGLEETINNISHTRKMEITEGFISW